MLSYTYSFISGLWGRWLLLGPIEISLFRGSIWCSSRCPRIGSSMLYHCRLDVGQTSLMAKMASPWVCISYGHSVMLLLERLGTQFNTCFVPESSLGFLPLSPPDVFRIDIHFFNTFRILYLDRMPELLSHGYSTWCWTISNTIKRHSFISQVLLLQSWSPRMGKRSYGERLYPRYLSGHAWYGSIRLPNKKKVPLSIGCRHFSPGNPEND
jgi:hypothetical protein